MADLALAQLGGSAVGLAGLSSSLWVEFGLAPCVSFTQAEGAAAALGRIIMMADVQVREQG